MPSPDRRRLEALASPRQPADLADDLLDQILLRVTCPADLARASTACAFFRRLVTDAGFLRRYRSLHPPLLLGFINTVSSGFQPAEAPHPNASVARSIASHAAGFSFDYLPPTRRNWNPWDVCDVRDGRVLLKSSPMVIMGVHFPDLAVCDPLFRQYRLLPPIPDDLLACIHFQEQIIPLFEAFLVPSGEEEEDGASFRVIGRAYRAITSVVFVFSSGSGLWSLGATWDDLNLGGTVLRCRCYACGYIYWKVMGINKLLKLDINRMDFSVIDLPPHYDERDVIVVEAGKEKVGVFSHIKFGKSVYHAIQEKEGEIADVCQSEIATHLPAHYDCCLVGGAAEGYIFFVGFPKDRSVDAAGFSLQVKTLKIEMVCQTMFQSCFIHPYFGYPPSMSSRRICTLFASLRCAEKSVDCSLRFADSIVFCEGESAALC